jgi:Domain of unknown function (DUF4126)
MDLAAHVISAGWASGVNAYLTVALLSLLGRSGAVEVPDQLESDPILYGSLVLFAIEFVADKVPYADNLWDAGQTLFRPAIGSALGVAFAGEAGVDNLDEVLSGGTAGGTALASHAVKAGLRLGINASPEPVSNIIASVTEDGLVAAIVAFSLEQPEIAAVIALLLLAGGITLVVLIWTRIRRTLIRLMRRPGDRAPPG